MCEFKGQQPVGNKSVYGHSHIRLSEGLYFGLNYFTSKMYLISTKSSPEEKIFCKRYFSLFYYIGSKCIISCFNITTLSSVGDITLYLLRDACNLVTAEIVRDIKVFL